MSLKQNTQKNIPNTTQNTTELTDLTNINEINKIKGTENFDGKEIAGLDSTKFTNFIKNIKPENFKNIKNIFTETLKEGNKYSANLFLKLIEYSNIETNINNLYIGTQKITTKNGQLRIKRNNEKKNQNKKYYDAIHISDKQGKPLYLIIKIGKKIHIGNQTDILQIINQN